MLQLICYTLNYNGVVVFSCISLYHEGTLIGKSVLSDKLRDTSYIRV